jgi:hypothetical protein
MVDVTVGQYSGLLWCVDWIVDFKSLNIAMRR